MKKIILMLVIVIFSTAKAQDDLTSEIDKLESGEVEESTVDSNPTESAQEVESEIQAADGQESFQESAPAPDTLPEDVEALAPQEELPSEDTQEVSQPEFKEVPEPEMIETTPDEVAEPEDASPVPTEPEQEIAEPSSPEPSPAEEFANQIVPSDFEARLNRIYEQFYKEATTDELWTQIVGDKINENYAIQPGDTLWDISQTFFGNGHYWPKVWQVNDSITNPHNIEPGFTIQFVPGNSKNAPQINIVKEDGEPTPATGSVAQLEDPNTPRPEAVPVIPPPGKRSVPVLQNLPPSLPFIKGPAFSGYDKQGFAVDRKKIPVAPSRVYLSSYVSEEAPISQGKIIDHDGEDRENATLFDLIYVKTESPMSVGDKLVAFNIGKKVMSIENDSYVGKQIHMLGELKIQSLINSDENIYKALITKAIGQISTGSYIVKGNLVSSDITETGTSTSISANVLGGDFHPIRNHISMHEIVYLDKGSQDGIREGQLLSIIKNPRIRNKGKSIQDLSVQIAKVKIVKVTQGLSTGIILSPVDDIRKGDIAGPLRKQAKNMLNDMEAESSLNEMEQSSDEELESGQEESSDEFIEEE